MEKLAALVWLVPAIVLLFFFAWSVGVLIGMATVYFQDTQHLCEVTFQGLIYLTPVLYPASLLRDSGLEWLVKYNPLAALIELVRSPVLQGVVPPGEVYAVAAWFVALLFAGASVMLTATGLAAGAGMWRRRRAKTV